MAMTTSQGSKSCSAYPSDARPPQAMGHSVENKSSVVLSVFQAPAWYLKNTHNIRIRAETVRQFLRAESFARILDIGCGDGSLSLPLLNSARHLALLDFSEGMLSAARAQIPRELLPHVEIFQQNALSAAFPPRSYDVILCVGVLAHVDSPESLLNRIASWLKPGGSLILQYTEADHVMSIITRSLESIRGVLRSEKYERNQTKGSELLDGLRRRGFELQASFRYSQPLLGMQRIARPEILYRMMRFVFGTYPNGRLSSWGNECLYHLKAKGLVQGDAG